MSVSLFLVGSNFSCPCRHPLAWVGPFGRLLKSQHLASCVRGGRGSSVCTPLALTTGRSRFGSWAHTPPWPSHRPSCSRSKLQKDHTGTFIAVLPRTAPSSEQRQFTVHMPARLQHLRHQSALKHHSHVFVRGCSSCFHWLRRLQSRIHQQNQSCFKKQVCTQQSLQRQDQHS